MKKTSAEQSRGDDGEEMFAFKKEGWEEGARGEGESFATPSDPSFYPSWKLKSSDSEFSDAEGNAQSKLRYIKTLHVHPRHYFLIPENEHACGCCFFIECSIDWT